jgi:hypothetical protein
VLRCLVSWTRLDEQSLPDASPAELAAALVALVGRRAGLNITRQAAAAAYSAPPQRVTAVARQLQPLLALSAQRWW